MESVYLTSRNLKHNEICRICRISRTTLASYLKQYKEGGIERLRHLGYTGKTNELLKHKTTLEEYFKEHPPGTAAEAREIIERLTDIKRSPTQIREFMKRIGMKCRKVGFVPGKVVNDPDKLTEQDTFREEKLKPRLAEAKDGKREVFFMDAAHFVHGTFLGMIWCFMRLFIPSPSGRKRFNVLGAVNAVTKKVHTFTNETYINSESVCQLLLLISKEYAESVITVVSDNARYQRCMLVQNYAAELGIELLYLPSYSPQLNLIERFWRFVRKECLYSKYYKDFSGFREAIKDCIENADTKKRKELETLMSWNFQSFKKVKILTV
jgi:transposase